MFARIARRYDLLNHLLSGSTDKRWRRRVRRKMEPTLARTDARILDVACGTGDLALELRANGAARITGLDFCRPMLEIAKRKSADEIARAPLPYVEADALGLPFADATFDGVTIAFGLRNLASVEDGLAELRRILKPGAQAVILEFSQPIVPGFRQLFDLYFNRVLPRIGGIVSGDSSAYEYLPRSVKRFPDQRSLAEMMRQTGFRNVAYENLTGGIAAIHTGERESKV
jgi:demethylmenaquinone methyltransferase/2-methoxy-6-polyprenyl-1,4-benzoquinol methylase